MLRRQGHQEYLDPKLYMRVLREGYASSGREEEKIVLVENPHTWMERKWSFSRSDWTFSVL